MSFPLSRVAGLCITLVLGTTAPLAGAQPGGEGRTHEFSVEAGTLEDALNAFARQAGLTLSFDPALTQGRQAPALSGRYTVAEGLKRLLDGSRLTANIDGSSAVVRPAPAASVPSSENSLPAVLVTAAADPANTLGSFRRSGPAAPVEPGLVEAASLERWAASDLEDVFATQPEMVVGGGHAIAQKIYVRGLEDTQLNVTVDGAAQAGQAFHHTGRVQIEPELLKLVEVQPGTGDATAGPGALGGVLRFVTKDPQDLLRAGEPVGVLAKATYFSNAEGLKGHASVFGRLSDTWAALAAFTYQDLGDYEDGSGRRVASTGARQDLGFLKLVGRFDAGHTLRLGYDHNRDDGERNQRPQWVTSSFNPAYPLTSERRTWNLGYGWQPGNDLVDLELTVFNTQSELEQNVIGRWGVYLGQIDSTGFDVRNTSRWGPHQLIYGVDYRKDSITAGSAAAPSEEREDGSIAGVYAQGTLELMPRLELGAGARYDRYRLTNINDRQLRSSGFSPNASLRWSATSDLTLLAGHARALRGAKVRDAFKLSSIETNAPGLEPERARTSELGFEYTRGAWRLNGKAYRTTVRDAVADPIGRPTQYENVGTLRSRGVLLHTAYRWQRLAVGAGIHHNKSRLNGDRLNGYEHNGLGTSQGDTLTGSLDYQLNERIGLGWTGRFVKSIKALETSVGTVRKPGYGLHDVYANWRPLAGDAVTMSLVVKNLFDKDYLDHGSNEDFQHIPDYEGIVGSREPGREFRVSVSIRF